MDEWDDFTVWFESDDYWNEFMASQIETLDRIIENTKSSEWTVADEPDDQLISFRSTC